jgi:hypothetical protein
MSSRTWTCDLDYFVTRNDLGATLIKRRVTVRSKIKMRGTTRHVGRKPRAETNASETITLRVTPGELAIIDEAVKSAGRSRGSWIRERILMGLIGAGFALALFACAGGEMSNDSTTPMGLAGGAAIGTAGAPAPIPTLDDDKHATPPAAVDAGIAPTQTAAGSFAMQSPPLAADAGEQPTTDAAVPALPPPPPAAADAGSPTPPPSVSPPTACKISQGPGQTWAGQTITCGGFWQQYEPGWVLMWAVATNADGTGPEYNCNSTVQCVKGAPCQFFELGSSAPPQTGVCQ